MDSKHPMRRRSQKRDALDMLASKGLLTHNPTAAQKLYSQLKMTPKSRMAGSRRRRRRTHRLKRRLKV